MARFYSFYWVRRLCDKLLVAHHRNTSKPFSGRKKINELLLSEDKKILVTFMFATKDCVCILRKRKMFRFIEIFPFSLLLSIVKLNVLFFKSDLNQKDVLCFSTVVRRALVHVTFKVFLIFD